MEDKNLLTLVKDSANKKSKNFLSTHYIISRQPVIVDVYDKAANSATIIFPSDKNTHINYYYPNKTNDELSSGQKVYLVRQTNLTSQGWLDDMIPVNVTMADLYLGYTINIRFIGSGTYHDEYQTTIKLPIGYDARNLSVSGGSLILSQTEIPLPPDNSVKRMSYYNIPQLTGGTWGHSVEIDYANNALNVNVQIDGLSAGYIQYYQATIALIRTK